MTVQSSSPVRLEVVLELPDRVPLDEVLVGVVRVLNHGPEPVTVSARINLIEGDLAVIVSGPGGQTARAGWPFPVDSGPREVELRPGQAISGSLPLVVNNGSQPIFPVAGSYTLTAQYAAAVDVLVTSAPVKVYRDPPTDQRVAQALQDRDVLQSLLSVAEMGQAASGLADLAAGTAPVARLLARLAMGNADEVQQAARDIAGSGRSAGARSGPLSVAATVSAVLPPGLFSGDERRESIVKELAPADDTRVQAVLSGEPRPEPLG